MRDSVSASVARTGPKGVPLLQVWFGKKTKVRSFGSSATCAINDNLAAVKALRFAGIQPSQVRMIAQEQRFAEKHAARAKEVVSYDSADGIGWAGYAAGCGGIASDI
jgi:hypothetical protein